MTETLVQWFVQNLGGSAAKELIIFIISMIPILELRGGLLAAGPAFLNVPMWRAIPICIIGNLIPVPFILLFITKIFTWLKGTKHLKPFVEKMENPGHEQEGTDREIRVLGPAAVRRYPASLGTGAWTGSLIAALLGIKFKKAFPAVILGILLASFIMTVLSYTVIGGIFG